ncbi:MULTISPECIES: LysR family transcriptional regulator [unclassified Bordetella]|uniref:LysR family transcriptional regulator n=1 Tax=unclassified Bordetella TaxID=2630031 RepID=UPI00132AFD30|nr:MULTISPECIES: LysR family transcriptional regulator [unclassified Bordetella]MVW72237.1 LysR family transcriptional regulator [Bordetella sp. 15P40C-2]MVW78896.1 LysR family transcriptional regulator [Bordetella sp. 02P26C-1]
MRFSLRQMEVFRAVMLTGSIKGASRLLFTSQPALSRIVAHTELTLGLTLFNRVKGKLVPTAEAEALFREVDQCYQQVLRVDDFARGLVSGPSGVLNLACSPALSRGVVARAITRFVQKYPNIQVNHSLTLLNGMAQDVLSNKVDLAVSVLPIEHPNLHVTPFMEGRMVCVVPRGHELTKLDRVEIADLARYPLIAHHPGIAFGQLTAAAFEKANVSLQACVYIHHTEMACSLVQAGAGVAMVDQFTAESLVWPGVQVLPLAEHIPLTPSIVRSAFDTGKSHASKFIDVLLKSD